MEISKEELLDFAKQIYEESCNGYMDLKDSCCLKVVEDFYLKKQKEKVIFTLNNSKNFYNKQLTS